MTANGAIDAKYCAFQDEDTLYYIDSITHKIGGAWTKHIASEALADYILSTGTELKLKEETKFEVGDVIKSNIGLIGMIDRKAITGDYIVTDGQNECAIIKATATLATPEEIEKWNKEVLGRNHLHYSKSKRKIIHWFLPYDKVVVRCDDTFKTWEISFFGWYDEDCNNPYTCINGSAWKKCLPYNDKTAKLVGMTDDYEEGV